MPISLVKRREPASAEQPAGVAHRVKAALTRPVRERRAGDDDRAEQFGRDGGKHHHRPARLAIADHAGFAVRIGVQLDHPLKKYRLGAGDVFDRLTGHGVGQEANEITGVPRSQRYADFAVSLEAADARTVPSARINDHERSQLRINRDPLGGHDPHQPVVDRSLEGATIDDQFNFVPEHVRHGLSQMLAIAVPPLSHHIPEQDHALRKIDDIIQRGSGRIEGSTQIASSQRLGFLRQHGSGLLLECARLSKMRVCHAPSPIGALMH